MIRKVDIVSAKVNRATPQSDFVVGFYPDKRDSKLCFEVLKTFSVPENNLPLDRGKTLPKSAFFKPFPMNDWLAASNVPLTK